MSQPTKSQHNKPGPLDTAKPRALSTEQPRLLLGCVKTLETAWLQKVSTPFFSDNKVLIVIGGDSNYQNEGEEARSVISRWAKKKVASQFGEEYLDGRQSFIFSWNEKHRPIHEEAMQHFLDPDKRGFKFEWRPRPLPKLTPPVVHYQPLPKPEATELPPPAATRPGQQVGNVSFLSSFVVLQNRCPWNCREQRPTVS